jgi:DNA modification methylase
VTGAQAYQDFLAAKAQLATPDGFDIDPADIHPALKPHQRDAVAWAVAGGRRALFESFGLGKSIQQLEIARLILRELGGGRGLIVCPLGVRQDIARDAALVGVETTFIRSEAEAAVDGIYLTNYETVRDGKLDPTRFDVISLDEAACLRGLGATKTFRELMRLYEGQAGYRFVATATPSPNEYGELLAYAAFLDIMDVGQARTRFFKRDSTKADHLTLLPSMEAEFWLWVNSWALFLQKPSDLGYGDTGYDLPPLEVRWHELPSAPPTERDDRGDGQTALFRNAAAGVTQAAAEKRDSLTDRVAMAAEIVAESPDDHFLIWHDLEAERHAIEAALPEAVTVWGSQDMAVREQRIASFADGGIRLLATKPSIAGAGCNLQRHCHRAVFTGIGFKFHDFIQAVHRVRRYLQDQPVRIDLICTEAERPIRESLLRKWREHDQLTARMGEIIREYGLSRDAMTGVLTRSIGVERQEAAAGRFQVVNNDAVLELRRMASDSAGLVVTSVPFGNQYEYSPSYNDFGHTENGAHFWQQMDYLTPELLRVLQPGRVAAIHVKDRITPGGINGLGFQTADAFHADALHHFRGHGLAYFGMITVVTDVVRENNQTYRLGYSEMCKDGSKMSVGMPEYVLLFRKPPTDTSNSYADVPVVKSKADYSLARWQFDAHGFWRSDGNRLLTPGDLAGLAHEQIFKLFRDHSAGSVYDYDGHVALGEALAAERKLPTKFMLLQPPSWHPDVWTDIPRMRTLNNQQERKGAEQHLCPLPLGIAGRLIERYSMPGETVLDPFMGLGTVPYMAVKAGRRGVGIELNPGYFADAAAYVQAAADDASIPTLFDLPGPGTEPEAEAS